MCHHKLSSKQSVGLFAYNNTVWQWLSPCSNLGKKALTFSAGKLDEHINNIKRIISWVNSGTISGLCDHLEACNDDAPIEGEQNAINDLSQRPRSDPGIARPH